MVRVTSWSGSGFRVGVRVMVRAGVRVGMKDFKILVYEQVPQGLHGGDFGRQSAPQLSTMEAVWM